MERKMPLGIERRAERMPPDKASPAASSGPAVKGPGVIAGGTPQQKETSKMPGIIVGIDGSAHSRRALEWAVNEAAIRQAAVTVLTVHQAVAGWSGPVAYPGDVELTDAARKKVQEATDAALAKLAAGVRPPSVTVEAINGFPTVELLKAAADADMIVVGSRGAGGFTKLMLGSVSMQIVHHAPCPVVVVPGDRD
jgi:nucleotide-binding universal stress UspA family protein